MSIIAGFCVYLWKRPVMKYTDRDIGVSGSVSGGSGRICGGFRVAPRLLVAPGVPAGCLRVSLGCAEVCPGGMPSERRRQRRLMVWKIGLLKQIRQLKLKQL